MIWFFKKYHWIIKRLSLIKLVIEYFDPNNEYKKLKLKNQEIKKIII